MKKIKKAIKVWKKGKKFQGYHPTGFDQININSKKILKEIGSFSSTKCCGTGTCS